MCPGMAPYLMIPIMIVPNDNTYCQTLSLRFVGRGNGSYYDGYKEAFDWIVDKSPGLLWIYYASAVREKLNQRNKRSYIWLEGRGPTS
jgi:hypothetical protein